MDGIKTKCMQAHGNLQVSGYDSLGPQGPRSPRSPSFLLKHIPSWKAGLTKIIIIFRHAEIFKKYFSHRSFFSEGNWSIFWKFGEHSIIEMESSQNQTIIQQRPGEPAIQLQHVLCAVFHRFSYMFCLWNVQRSFVLAIYSQKEKIKKYKSVKLKRFLRFSIARIS